MKISKKSDGIGWGSINDGSSSGNSGSGEEGKDTVAREGVNSLNKRVNEVEEAIDELKSETHNHENKDILDSITQSKINEWDNKSEFSGDYNNLINKPNIPTKISELENDNNFISEIPNEYITENELNDKGYLTEHQDLSHLALKSETHNHENKDILDEIIDINITNWDDAYNHSQMTHAPNNAEPNVQSDWNIVDETSSAYIKNKPTIPTKISELENDEGYLTGISDEKIIYVNVEKGELILTNNRYQRTTITNDTKIIFPSVDEFTRIHLYFNATNNIKLEFSDCKINTDPNIEKEKSYEIIATYDTFEWFVNIISYSGYISEVDEVILYSFGLLSDVHIDGNTDGDGVDEASSEADFKNALNFFKEQNVDFIAYCGDMVNEYSSAEADYNLLKTCLETTTITNYFIQGNHDYGSSDYFEDYLCGVGNYTIEHGDDLFIFLSATSVEGKQGVNQDSVDFLRSVINDNPDRRLFLIHHFFIRNHGSGDGNGGLYAYDAIGDDYTTYPITKEFAELVINTPNLIFCHGHSHFRFSTQDTYATNNFYHVDGECYSIHIPSCAKPRSKDMSTWNEGSEGYLVDVYSDRVEFKAIDLTTGTELTNYNQQVDLSCLSKDYTFIEDGLSLYIDADNVKQTGVISDISGNNQILTVNNIPTELVDGCLRFTSDDSSNIDCGFVPDAEEWTIEIYFKLRNTSTAQVIWAWGVSGDRISLNFEYNGEEFKLASPGGYYTANTCPTYSLINGDYVNNLFHIIISHKDKKGMAFINGIPMYHRTTSDVSSTEGNLKIGCHYTGEKEYADIDLKMFRFYNGKALTSYEMYRNYLSIGK